jgi:hypothetical protein
MSQHQQTPPPSSKKRSAEEVMSSTNEFKLAIQEGKKNLKIKAVFVYMFQQNSKFKMLLLPIASVDNDFDEILPLIKQLIIKDPKKGYEKAFTATIWDADIETKYVPGSTYLFSKVGSPTIFNEGCQFSCNMKDITMV